MLGVRRAIAARAHEALGRWRSDRLSATGFGFAARTAPGLITAAIADLAGAHRGLGLLETELLSSDVADAFLALEARSGAFWVDRLVALGETGRAAISWTDFLYGLKPLAAIDGDPASLWSWVPVLIRRFADRIAGQPIHAGDLLTFPAPESYLTEPPAAAGAQRILDAVIDLIGEEGMEGVSHRKVADRAGLSMASCQFFFGTKSDMIRAAVLELERRMHRSLHERLNARTDDEPLLISSAVPNRDFAALNSLHAPVARNPALQPVARVLRDFRGAHAWDRLKRRFPSADRIDAILWSTTYIGSLHPHRLAQPGTDGALRDRLALHLDNLFLHGAG
ncbi:MAG: TetR family transcriptional regulator [Sphingomonas sp.]